MLVKHWNGRANKVYYVFIMVPPIKTYYCPSCDDLFADGRPSEYKVVRYFCVLDKPDLNEAVNRFIEFEQGKVFCDVCVGLYDFSCPWNDIGQEEEYQGNVFVGIHLPDDIGNEIGRILIVRGLDFDRMRCDLDTDGGD